MSLEILNYSYLIFLTGALFFTFVIIISIFGMIFYNFFNRSSRQKSNFNFPEKIIFSFGIGFSIYIPFSMVVIAFKFVNFFTILLPFILIDISYIAKISHKTHLKWEIIRKFILNLKKSLLRNKVFVLILIFIISLQIIFQWSIISVNKSYIGMDPFNLAGKSLPLLMNGQIDDFRPFYPPGFEILYTSCLSILITPNFEQIYFFLKFIPIPFFSFYILIVALIIKRIFRKNSFIFFGLIMLLTANYTNMQFLHFFTSNIATVLITISFFIFLSKTPLFYSGIFFTSVFFVSPRVSIFYLIILFLFLVLKSFNSERNSKEYLKVILKTFLLSGVLFLPYIFLIYSNNSNIFELVNGYLYQLNKPFNNQMTFKPFNYFVSIIEIIFNLIRELLTYWIPSNVYKLDLKRFQNNSIIFSIFFIFALMGLFLSLRKHIKKKNRDIFLFIKSIMIFVFFLYFIPPFFPIADIFENLPFWFWMRPLEYFTFPIIIMECFFIKFLLVRTKELTKLLKTKYEFYNNYYQSKNHSKFLKIESIMVTTLLLSSFSNYLINQQNYYPWTEDYFFNDDQINTIFFINDKIPIGAKILVSDYGFHRGIDYNEIYNLLYNFEYIIWDFSVKNVYNLTRSYIITNNTKYILVDLQRINSSELSYFSSDEDLTIIFQNSRNIILQSD